MKSPLPGGNISVRGADCCAEQGSLNFSLEKDISLDCSGRLSEEENILSGIDLNVEDDCSVHCTGIFLRLKGLLGITASSIIDGASVHSIESFSKLRENN